MRFLRSAAIVMTVTCAISLPAAAQIPSTDIAGGTVSRRGRYSVTGTVREADGNRPLESVEVRLSTLTSGVAASTFTNSNGSFAFSDVPAGTYYLVVDEEGYERVQEEVNFSSRPPIAIQLSLRPEVSFSGARVGRGPTVSIRELSIPRRAREAMERGMSLLHGKSDYRGSLSQFQNAVREYPQYYEAYAQMGVVYMKLGDTAKSEQMLRTSIDMSQRGYADPLFILASMYSGQKRFADAEAVAREAVKLNPDSWEANQELARALLGLEQGPAAEASALEALRVQPDNPQTHLMLANIHLRMRNYAALIRDLDTYLQLAPNGPEANQARQMREQIFERMANIQPRTATEP
jgi:tetratricopeptide (TPR) repeat protein